MASGAKERLCRAAMGGDVAGITAALRAGADPNGLTVFKTPLQWAVSYGHIAAMAALLAAGARVDGTDMDGFTPLMDAAKHGQTAATATLLAAGADVHHSDVFGDTALHRALSCRCLDAARLLVEAGARTDVRNKEGKRPIDVVRPPRARVKQLRDGVTLLHCPVDVRRFGGATRPQRPP
jgi:ankyrin repeat protein